jgi:hypothetical protein
MIYMGIDPDKYWWHNIDEEVVIMTVYIVTDIKNKFWTFTPVPLEI